MSPLVKVAWGFVIVIALIPVGFPAHPHPEWNFYHLFPPPIGWLIVYLGIGALDRSSTTDFRFPRQLAAFAGVVAIPLWFPQVNHLIDPTYNHGVSQSWQWLVAMPTWTFGYVFSQRLGEAADAHTPRDRGAAGWFGVIRWGFVLAAVLPLLVYGAKWTQFNKPMQWVIGAVEIGLIIALFSYRRRVEFGRAGPKVWAEAAPSEAEQGDTATPVGPSEWEQFKAERAQAREEMRERRRERRENAKRPG